MKTVSMILLFYFSFFQTHIDTLLVKQQKVVKEIKRRNGRSSYQSILSCANIYRTELFDLIKTDIPINGCFYIAEGYDQVKGTIDGVIWGELFELNYTFCDNHLLVTSNKLPENIINRVINRNVVKEKGVSTTWGGRFFLCSKITVNDSNWNIETFYFEE